jgi:hypothetical protein
MTNKELSQIPGAEAVVDSFFDGTRYLGYKVDNEFYVCSKDKPDDENTRPPKYTRSDSL